MIVLLVLASGVLAYETDKPEDHTSTWMQLHGQVSQADPAYCTDCHTNKVDCLACHEVLKPRNHNGTWKRKAHGLKARWDRTNCLVCHQEDFCIECHTSTPPFSHRPGWGGLDDSQNRHCGSCHYPVQETTCGTCHETAHAPNAFNNN